MTEPSIVPVESVTCTTTLFAGLLTIGEAPLTLTKTLNTGDALGPGRNRPGSCRKQGGLGGALVVVVLWLYLILIFVKIVS